MDFFKTNGSRGRRGKTVEQRLAAAGAESRGAPSVVAVSRFWQGVRPRCVFRSFRRSGRNGKRVIRFFGQLRPRGPHQAADRNAFTHYTTISCKEICQTTAKQRSRTFVTESRAFALSRQRSRHTLRHSPAHRGAAAGARAGHVTLSLYGKKIQKSRKKSCEIVCFSLFSVQKHLFFGCKGKKSRCGARLPMPAGDAQMPAVSVTICGHSGLSRGKHGKAARAAAESREMLPVGRKKGQSRLRRRRERGNAACRREMKSRAGRREKKDFYKILTIS